LSFTSYSTPYPPSSTHLFRPCIFPIYFFVPPSFFWSRCIPSLLLPSPLICLPFHIFTPSKLGFFIFGKTHPSTKPRLWRFQSFLPSVTEYLFLGHFSFLPFFLSQDLFLTSLSFFPTRWIPTLFFHTSSFAVLRRFFISFAPPIFFFCRNFTIHSSSIFFYANFPFFFVYVLSPLMIRLTPYVRHTIVSFSGNFCPHNFFDPPGPNILLLCFS